MVMSDFDIRNYINAGRLVIKPLSTDTIRENGVDLKFSGKFRLLKRTRRVYDTRGNSDEQNPYHYEGETETDCFVLQPKQRIIVTTMEYLKMPYDVAGLCNLRSTYARLTVFNAPTAIDAGWEGYLVIGLIGSEFPVKLYKGERFLHVLFDKLTSPVDKPYSGKYQKQQGLVLPKMDDER